MNKKTTVTIGIPAYNEEINIGRLIKRLLAQKLASSMMLKEIIVVSDGSTDETVSIVKSIHNPIVRVISGKKRKGQQIRQNQLLTEFKGDVLVIIEADTLPYNDKTLLNLVTPFVERIRPDIGMVVGHAVSVPTTTLIEKIEVHGMSMKDRLFSEWKIGNNVFMCNGHSMKALKRDFAKNLLWPHNAPEDSYVYLRLKQLGLSFVKRHNAKSYVKRATQLEDYIRRYKKFCGGVEVLKVHFSPKVVEAEFIPPYAVVLKHILLSLVSSPILTSLYLITSVVVRIMSIGTKDFSIYYKPFASTKISQHSVISHEVSWSIS